MRRHYYKNLHYRHVGQSNPAIEVLKRDIARTLPNHKFFQSTVCYPSLSLSFLSQQREASLLRHLLRFSPLLRCLSSLSLPTLVIEMIRTAFPSLAASANCLKRSTKASALCKSVRGRPLCLTSSMYDCIGCASE